MDIFPSYFAAEWILSDQTLKAISFSNDLIFIYPLITLVFYCDNRNHSVRFQKVQLFLASCPENYFQD
jgi:hypothetical protein